MLLQAPHCCNAKLVLQVSMVCQKIGQTPNGQGCAEGVGGGGHTYIHLQASGEHKDWIPVRPGTDPLGSYSKSLRKSGRLGTYIHPAAGGPPPTSDLLKDAQVTRPGLQNLAKFSKTFTSKHRHKCSLKGNAKQNTKGFQYSNRPQTQCFSRASFRTFSLPLYFAL